MALISRGVLSWVWSRTYLGNINRFSSTTAEVIEDGKKLIVTSSEKKSTYHAIWLRHNCHCSACLTSSGQKTVSADSLSNSLKISSFSETGEALKFTWTNDKHVHNGFVPRKFLNGNSYSSPTFLSEKSTANQPLIAKTIPKISYKDVMESENGLWRWLKDINHYGLSLIYGSPVVPGTVIGLAQKISHLQKTIYGECFQVKTVKNPINIAYSEVDLPLHMDLAYYQSSPGLQLLHCIRFDDCVQGGESILLDTYPILEKMKQQYPKQFNTLTRIPATFQKLHYEREHPVHMVFQRPHVAVNSKNKIIGVHWAPAFEGPLQIAEDEVDDYYEAYILLSNMFEESPLKFTHRLKPGEVIVVNNHRVLHGRQYFSINGGERHLEGAYINIDEFKSQFKVLCSKLGHDEETVKHVFNECWSA